MSRPETVTVPLRTLIEFVGNIHNADQMTPAGVETAVKAWARHAQREARSAPLPVAPGGSVH